MLFLIKFIFQEKLIIDNQHKKIYICFIINFNHIRVNIWVVSLLHISSFWVEDLRNSFDGGTSHTASMTSMPPSIRVCCRYMLLAS